MWKKWNIVAGRHSEINNSMVHPLDPERKICIIADVPHLFKNIKNMLVNNKIIYISDKIKETFKLPTNEIKISHVKDILNYQKKIPILFSSKIN